MEQGREGMSKNDDGVSGFRKFVFRHIICWSMMSTLFLGRLEFTSFAAEKAEQKATASPGSLYAQSAVLMDGSSGRVLYEKNGEEFMANASTTKILTCILALENADLKDRVAVSAYAASMPDVQLHIKEGEQYYLEDLLYSLMLESHNDAAVAVAEHVSGSTEEFAKLMNQKAKEIGCKNTLFLTPNGLDATISQETEVKFHGTTATDLALIMRYCLKVSPQKEKFLQITRTPSYTFQNIEKTRNFSCRNHNAFLDMMEGALSGKTGFTGKAGYCYVGALEQEGKCYIVALLACGWPGNKNYKWADCRKMMEYGLENYQLYSLEELKSSYEEEMTMTIQNAKREQIDQEAQIPLIRQQGQITEVLLKNGEEIEIKITKNKLEAPVEEKQKVGLITYYIEGRKWQEEILLSKEKAEKADYKWCLEQIVGKIL